MMTGKRACRKNESDFILETRLVKFVRPAPETFGRHSRRFILALNHYIFSFDCVSFQLWIQLNLCDPIHIYSSLYTIYTILYKAHRLWLELTLDSTPLTRIYMTVYSCLQRIFTGTAWKTIPGWYATRNIERKSRMYSVVCMCVCVCLTHDTNIENSFVYSN